MEIWLSMIIIHHSQSLMLTVKRSFPLVRWHILYCTLECSSSDKMWTFCEFLVILVLCICKIFTKNQDRQGLSEFGCDAQDKRGVLWKSDREGLTWHSCEEIEYGNHDLGIYKIVIGNIWWHDTWLSKNVLINSSSLQFN